MLFLDGILGPTPRPVTLTSPRGHPHPPAPTRSPPHPSPGHPLPRKNESSQSSTILNDILYPVWHCARSRALPKITPHNDPYEGSNLNLSLRSLARSWPTHPVSHKGNKYTQSKSGKHLFPGNFSPLSFLSLRLKKRNFQEERERKPLNLKSFKDRFLYDIVDVTHNWVLPTQSQYKIRECDYPRELVKCH